MRISIRVPDDKVAMFVLATYGEGERLIMRSISTNS
jgi:hypothetical protein